MADSGATDGRAPAGGDEGSWTDGDSGHVLGSVRFRTTALATLVVGLALVVGAFALVFATRSSLASSAEATAQSRAEDVAALAEEGAVPVPLPGRGEALVAQVVTPEGDVVSSSPDLADEGPISEARLAPGETYEASVDSLDEPGSEDEYEPAFVYGLGVDTPDGPVTVLVAASLQPVEQATAALAPVLLVVVPLVLLVTAGAVWVLTGRALEPVEDIRAEAAAISGGHLDRRVPVPDSQDEVRRLADTMNEMLDRLEASDAQQRRFVADASHELRSPIAAIRTMLDVAKRSPEAVDMPELIDDLSREDVRLERLTDDLFTLARSDERGLKLALTEADLADIAAEEVASARARDHVEVHLLADGPVTLQADADALRRLLRNLLDNALRHTDSAVWVEADHTASGALLRVSDDGPGIPEEDRERIFDRFVRLDQSRARTEGGAGLGLAVCLAIAEAHRGSVAVIEPLHGGATIEVRLPG